MSIYIAISGGRKVYAFVERIFSTPPEARAYLFEHAVPHTTKGRQFDHAGKRFQLSHPFEDIYTHDKLPDNEMSLNAAQRLAAAQRALSRPTSSLTSSSTTTPSPTTSGSRSRDTDYPPHSNSPVANPSKNSSQPAKVAASSGSITLKQICEELKIEPSKARSILRKKLNREEGGSWTFDEATATTVRKILKS